MDSDRSATHLSGVENIARFFSVGPRCVRQWKRDGAPIILVGRKHQANYGQLWQWLCDNGGGAWRGAE